MFKLVKRACFHGRPLKAIAIVTTAFLISLHTADALPSNAFQLRSGLVGQLPPAYKRVSITSPPPGLELAATQPQDGLPSLNIIAQGGSYPITAPVDQQTKRILESYQAVGIKDATVTASTLVPSRLGNVFTAAISYAQERISGSFVAIIPAIDRHFILTVVYDDRSKSAGQAAFEEVLASLSLPPNLMISAPAKKTNRNTQGSQRQPQPSVGAGSGCFDDSALRIS